MSSTIKRFDAGSRTVEGNVSGSRAAELERKRQQEAEAFEAQKKLKTSSQKSASLDKFRTATKASAAEQAFSNQTVGLVTAEDFVKATEAKQQKGLEQLVLGDQSHLSGDGSASSSQQQRTNETDEERAKREKAERKARKKKLKEQKKRMATLSFAGDEEEAGIFAEDEVETTITTNATKPLLASKKDPTVDTSFLPDKHRDEQLIQQRLQLEQEWVAKQEVIRQEKLEITYSYWDGSGHRRSIVCRKGDTIGQFLKLALEKQLSKEFRNLQGLAHDDLMYGTSWCYYCCCSPRLLHLFRCC